MQIAIFSDLNSQSFKRLLHAIQLADMGRPPEVHSDVKDFCGRFRTVAYRPDLIILMPTGLKALEVLADARDLFASSRIIVILPKREPSVVSMGHLFRPSFITFKDDDFGEVAAILRHLGQRRPFQRCG